MLPPSVPRLWICRPPPEDVGAHETDSEAENPGHDEVAEKPDNLHRQDERARRPEKAEQVEGLLDSHPEPNHRSINDAVHGIVELTGKDDGDRHHHHESGELLQESSDGRDRNMSLDVAQRNELEKARSPHRHISKCYGQDEHVPGLTLVEIVAVDKKREEASAKGECDRLREA